ncbi:MAG: hypothetical protein LC753_02020 [Acidobacteria bacterium]|nr:hypothetical protein [Acidobacteriota bacterium]
MISRRPAFQNPFEQRVTLLRALAAPGPIVVSGNVLYLQLWYYAPAQLKGRLLYIADPASARRLTKSDTLDRGYLALTRWTALPVQEYETFVAMHHQFRVYAAGSGWLIQRLEEDGASFDPLDEDAGGRLYFVTLP